MGDIVAFNGNGRPFSGYFCPSDLGPGPGVIVIQEWWGLVGHINDVADRFAQAGFSALAPDFYDGQSTTEPDEAGTLMMALDIDNAAKVIVGAVEFLKSNELVQGRGLGVVGFCMGGQLSMYAACLSPDIRACVNFYGIHPNVHPDFSKLQAPMLGFFAEHDDYASPSAVLALSQQLQLLGKAHEFTTYAGAHHAFFNSDRTGVYDPVASEDAWSKMIEFFKNHLL